MLYKLITLSIAEICIRDTQSECTYLSMPLMTMSSMKGSVDAVHTCHLRFSKTWILLCVLLIHWCLSTFHSTIHKKFHQPNLHLIFLESYQIPCLGVHASWGACLTFLICMASIYFRSYATVTLRGIPWLPSTYRSSLLYRVSRCIFLLLFI